MNLLAGSHFEGIIPPDTNIAVGAGATFNGRLLAQTAVTLISTTGDAPAATRAPGTITIIKNTVPNGPQDFNFTIVGPNPEYPLCLWTTMLIRTLPRLRGLQRPLPRYLHHNRAGSPPATASSASPVPRRST